MLLNWHRHLHLLAMDGAYRDDGSFVPLSFHDPATLTELFRRKVLAAFVKDGVVTIVSDKSDGPTAGTHTFEPLEFLARLLAHVPRKSEIYVRYYGAYAVRRRAAWRLRGIRPGSRLPEEPVEPVPEVVRARRRRWAELLRKVWDVDVSICPTCGGPMAILTFTMDRAVIDATLRRLRGKGHDLRAGPWATRAPPPSIPP
jgi:hypothetical protein